MCFFLIVSQADAQVSNAMLESELSINATVSPELLPSPYMSMRDNGNVNSSNEDKEANNKQSSMCRIDIELTSYTTLHDVQVFLQADKPLVITKDDLFLANLCKDIIMSYIYYLL